MTTYSYIVLGGIYYNSSLLFILSYFNVATRKFIVYMVYLIFVVDSSILDHSCLWSQYFLNLFPALPQSSSGSSLSQDLGPCFSTCPLSLPHAPSSLLHSVSKSISLQKALNQITCFSKQFLLSSHQMTSKQL